MFYVIEFQTRPDGVVNTSITGRSTFASALSLYHERISVMVMTKLYTSVSVSLVDANLDVVEHQTVQTQWSAE